jgi:cytoskeletal protein CcmA (bactofilin family)
MKPLVRLMAGVTALLALTGPGISPSAAADSLHRATRSGLHLYVGDKLAISEAAPGGLIAGGGEVRIEGVHAGDILAGGGNVTMDHVDTGRVVAAGGHVSISGALHNGVIAAGGDVSVSRDTTITNDAILSGGHLVLDSDVSGDVIAAGGTVELSGHVAGDVEIRASKIILHPGARIDGNLTTATKSDDFEVPAGVTIGGKVAREPWDSAHFENIVRLRDLMGWAGVAIGIIVLASLVLLGGIIWLFWYLMSGPRRAPE